MNCTCGAVKSGAGGHFDWCDLMKPQIIIPTEYPGDGYLDSDELYGLVLKEIKNIAESTGEQTMFTRPKPTLAYGNYELVSSTTLVIKDSSNTLPVNGEVFSHELTSFYQIPKGDIPYGKWKVAFRQYTIEFTTYTDVAVLELLRP